MTMIDISGAFQLYDHDRNGIITREEMLAVMKAIYKTISQGQQGTLPNDEKTPEEVWTQVAPSCKTAI